MSWRTASTIMIVVFAIAVVWATLATPLTMLAADLQGIGTSGQFNANTKIDGYVSSWFNMILIFAFGVLAWGVWRVVRKEVTRAFR